MDGPALSSGTGVFFFAALLRGFRALAGFFSGADGSPAAVVPDDLHNYLHVRKDANGNPRILETDGSTPPPEAVEVTNE